MEPIEVSKIKIANDFIEHGFRYASDFNNAYDFYEAYLQSTLKGGDDVFYLARMEEGGEEELRVFVIEQFNNLIEVE